MADEKDELVVVGPAGDNEEIHSTEAEVDAAEEGKADREADERTGHSDDVDDPEREAIRKRRREEKQRKKENRGRERTELNFLRSRNEAVERELSQIRARQDQGEVLNIDQRIGTLDDQIRQAEEIHAAAITKGDGGAASEALRLRDEFRDGKRQLLGLKGQKVQEVQARKQPNQPDPEIKARAEEWMGQNDWFDPTLRDQDSAIARVVEDRLFNEGRLDPRSDAYWEEYNKRLAKVLPDKAKKMKEADDKDEDEKDDDEPPRRNNGGPKITTGGRERPLRKNEVYIDADRKAAMIEAGVWDDEKLRARYLKRYQAYDKEHGRNRH